jgi:hypothetical protein
VFGKALGRLEQKKALKVKLMKHARTPDRYKEEFAIVFEKNEFTFEGYNPELEWVAQEDHVKEAFKFWLHKLIIQPLETEVLLIELLRARPEERHYPR